ncbi:MAG: HNH endonuclease [Bacteroidetes bacterium]|nr:HNH endonuclease [Bacteroidota bacterium]
MIDQYKEIKFSYAYNMAGSLREKMFRNSKDDYLNDYFDFNDATFQDKLLKPNKLTILHDYIKNEFELEIEYLGRKADTDLIANDWEELLNDYKIKYLKSEHDDEDETYVRYLEGKVNEYVAEKVANETFQLLFSDRMFCLKFNSVIADNIKDLKLVDYPDLLEKDGKLKRCTYFSEWVQPAVFLRDKGCCAVCLRDLTGLLKTGFNEAIDHIVPLNLGGTNDVTNFQLICRDCNLKKLGHTIETSEHYPTYF